MDLSKKLVVILAVPLLAQVGTMFGFAYLARAAEEAADRANTERQLAVALRNLDESMLENMVSHHSELDLKRDAGEPRGMQDSWIKLVSGVRSLEDLSRQDPFVLNNLSLIRQSLIRGRNDYYELVRKWAETHRDKSSSVGIRPDWRVLRAESQRLADLMHDLDVHTSQDLDRNVTEQNKTYADIRSFLMLSGFASVFLTLALALFLIRTVVFRLNILRDNATRLATDQQLRRRIYGNDEIALFDKTFHSMAASLREALMRERAVVENAQDLIAAIDEELRFGSVNPAAESLFGCLRSSLLGRHITDFVSQSDLAKTLSYFDTVRGATSDKPLEICIDRSDGLKMDSLWSTVWSAENKSFYCVAHNISARRQSERLREESIAMLNHDLRSPLTSLSLMLSFINSKISDESLSEPIKRAEASCERLLNMIGNLLDLDRLTTGHSRLALAKCDIAQIVLAACDVTEPASQRKGIIVECDLDSIFVDADGALLERVMVNLLSNAIKFAPENSSITLSARTLNNQLEVRVKDQGPGIPPDKLEAVFERYRQVEEHRSIFAGGSGLGLAICKAIVELHGGKIRVESQVNQGSSFFFSIPMTRAAAGSSIA